jgi:hypothetical protein
MNSKNLLSSLMLALALVGCGGGTNVQQYLINWDDQTVVTQSRSNATCSQATANNMSDVITTDATSSLVISIYQGDATGSSKPYYADFGSHTLAGTKGADGSYNLSDAQVTHNVTDPNHVIDDSDTVTVTMTQTGQFVSGTWSEEKYHSDTSSTTGCLTTTKFRGQQISSGSNNAPIPSAGANH